MCNHSHSKFADLFSRSLSLHQTILIYFMKTAFILFIKIFLPIFFFDTNIISNFWTAIDLYALTKHFWHIIVCIRTVRTSHIDVVTCGMGLMTSLPCYQTINGKKNLRSQKKGKQMFCINTLIPFEYLLWRSGDEAIRSLLPRTKINVIPEYLIRMMALINGLEKLYCRVLTHHHFISGYRIFGIIFAFCTQNMEGREQISTFSS